MPDMKQVAMATLHDDIVSICFAPMSMKMHENTSSVFVVHEHIMSRSDATTLFDCSLHFLYFNAFRIYLVMF
jgi:hypothetical protein